MTTFDNYSMENDQLEQTPPGKHNLYLVLNASILCPFALVVICFFTPMIVYVTVKEKELRNPCNIFLAFGSLCESMFLMYWVIEGMIAFTATNVVRQIECFFLQMPSSYGYFSANLMILFVGMDRLFSIAMPLRYVCMTPRFRRWYIVTVLSITTLHAFLFISMQFMVANATPNWAVQCFIGDTYNGWLGQYVLLDLVVLNVATIVVYLILLMVVRNRMSNASANDGSPTLDNKRSLKAIFVIMTFVVGSWIAHSVHDYLQSTIPFPGEYVHYSPAGNIFEYLGSASNVPILYMYNPIYRKTINKVLRHVCPCLIKQHKKQFTVTKTIQVRTVDRK